MCPHFGLVGKITLPAILMSHVSLVLAGALAPSMPTWRGTAIEFRALFITISLRCKVNARTVTVCFYCIKLSAYPPFVASPLRYDILCCYICCYLLLYIAILCCYLLLYVTICCCMLLYVAICCYLLLYVAICCYLLLYVAIC